MLPQYCFSLCADFFFFFLLLYIFVLGFAVVYCVMQFVISSQSTPQNSFPYPRQLAFCTPNINHAEFGEPIWPVSVGCTVIPRLTSDPANEFFG